MIDAAPYLHAAGAALGIFICYRAWSRCVEAWPEYRRMAKELSLIRRTLRGNIMHGLAHGPDCPAWPFLPQMRRDLWRFTRMSLFHHFLFWALPLAGALNLVIAAANLRLVVWLLTTD